MKETNFLRTIGIHAAVSNPFFPTVGPPIRFDLIFRYELLTQNLEISGDTGYFPSFEGYYELGDDSQHSFLKWGPEGQATVTSLAGTPLGINLRNFDSSKVNVNQ